MSNFSCNLYQFISNKSEMDVVLNEEDTSYPVHQHPQWELVDNKAWARLTLKKYECCQQPFTLITISVQLRRRPQFYHYLTVGPAAVLGFLVPVIYLVPSRSQDKTTFGELFLAKLVTCVKFQDYFCRVCDVYKMFGLFLQSL